MFSLMLIICSRLSSLQLRAFIHILRITFSFNTSHIIAPHTGSHPGTSASHNPSHVTFIGDHFLMGQIGCGCSVHSQSALIHEEG